MSGREVRGRLFLVDEPSDQQLWAAARTLARLAVRAGADAAVLRDALEAIGFDPTDPPPRSREADSARLAGPSGLAASIGGVRVRLTARRISNSLRGGEP